MKRALALAIAALAWGAPAGASPDYGAQVQQHQQMEIQTQQRAHDTLNANEAQRRAQDLPIVPPGEVGARMRPFGAPLETPEPFLILKEGPRPKRPTPTPDPASAAAAQAAAEAEAEARLARTRAEAAERRERRAQTQQQIVLAGSLGGLTLAGLGAAFWLRKQPAKARAATAKAKTAKAATAKAAPGKPAPRRPKK